MAANTDNTVSTPATLMAEAQNASKKGPPPVHLWDPPFCGDMDMEIRADGSWHHEGAPITRPAMVALFASILKREGDEYFLVTPVEKLRIRVVDAPFVAIDAAIGEEICFTTNVGDTVIADANHEIEIRGTIDAPRPYVHVRSGLWALIDRKTFYRLADAAMPDEQGRMVLNTSGCTFRLEP